MAISEFEIRRCENELEKFLKVERPSAYLRDKLDIGYRIKDQSVELFEIRSARNNLKELNEYPFAKSTFVKSKNHWKIYWQRADLKWHSYEPYPVARTIEEFLCIVIEDEHACFFG